MTLTARMKLKQWRFLSCNKLFILALAASLPSMIACFWLVFSSDFDGLESTTILLFAVIPCLICLSLLLVESSNMWKVVANLLMAYREGDYSIRASSRYADDTMGLVITELNALADHLQNTRNAELASRKLLERILSEIDVAFFLFDNHSQLVMVNSYGASLYQSDVESLLGKTVKDLSLEFAQLAAHSTTHEHQFIAKKSRFLVKNSGCRQYGESHRVILLADIGENLRSEQFDAWQQLIRILSHEINNAMTPIKTSVQGMRRMLNKEVLPENWQDYFTESSQIIEQRVDNIARLVRSYAEISRLPLPEKNVFSLPALIQRMADSFGHDKITVQCHHEIDIFADEMQIEQLLVNVIKNALEASSNSSSPVFIDIKETQKYVIIDVIDDGLGLSNLDNLFIPYFTTKSSGSGIGLFLSKQIVEAHDGSIELKNRKEHAGCVATIKLPLDIH